MNQTSFFQKENSDAILDYWFVQCTPENWYKKDPAFDADLKSNFGSVLEKALAGELDSWADSPTSALAKILLLDQFTRNIFRDTPRAFAGDRQALALSLQCQNRGDLNDLDADHCMFMLMPVMHSEDLAIHEAGLPVFKKLTNANTYDYAVQHHDIIAKFGRYPHRNAILERTSTEQEQAFLSKPGSSF